MQGGVWGGRNQEEMVEGVLEGNMMVEMYATVKVPC